MTLGGGALAPAAPDEAPVAAALDGLRILDLTSYLPGPYASMVLADLGAEVIVVEPPAGEPGRRVLPAAGHSSALHQWVGRNKQSLVLDLKSSDERRVFHQLASTCDVVLEGFTPGVAERLGVGYADCRRLNPAVVYCSISGLGHGHEASATPGHDINYLARVGFLDQVRDEAGQPVPIGPTVADLSAGLHAAVGILAALHHRDRTGEGQHVDVSLIGSALALVGPQLVKALAPEPLPREHDHNLGADPGYRTYRARDGRHLVLGALEEKFWRRLCEALDRPDLVDDRARDPRGTASELERLFAAEDGEHWDALLGPANCCYDPVRSIGDVAGDAHVRARGDLVADALPSPQPRNPIRMSATPPAVRHGAPPLGSHAGLGWSGPRRHRAPEEP